MLNKLSKKSIALLASSLVLVSSLSACSNLMTSSPSSDSSTSATSNIKPVGTNKLKLTRTNKDGVQTPIVPEDISFIKVGDKQLKASEIKIDTKSFSTKAAADSPVVIATYLGNGQWQFDVLIPGVKTVEIVTKDGQTIKVPFSDKAAEFRVDFNEVSKQLFGVELKPDGTNDTAGTIFKVDADGNLVINDEGKLDGVKLEDLKPISGIGSYLGNWVYNGLGFSIKLNVKGAGEGKLSVSADAFGQKGSGMVDYTTETDGSILGSAKVSTGTIKASASALSPAKIKVSLVDAGGIAAVAPFKFLLSNIELKRVVE